ncbi:MAG: cytochrome c oxidase subunit 3 [Alphaproteobacteria bacterium]
MAEGLRAREPFDAFVQQHEAARMGMLVFLATEIMLFGGLFAAILAVRIAHPHEFAAASARTHVFIGTANTAVLLTSSFAVAVAALAARAARTRLTSLWLAAASLLGVAFLGLKAVEYGLEYANGLLPGMSDPLRVSSPVEQLFMDVYLVSTGLHAVHVTIGILLLGSLAVRVTSGALRLPGRAVVVEVCGLYWHLVDVIWVFLFPALYLAR